MSTWGKAIVLAFALVATLVAPAHASNRISVSAAEVTLPPGQNTASVGVSWHTDGNQTVQIWIRETGKAAKLWRQEVNGSATWPYLHAGTTTTFELRGGPNYATVLGTTSSTGRLPGRLSADRTHLALAPGTTGTIDLSWATELSDAQVWVSHNGNPQKLYAQGPSGTGRITWISRGTTVFTLWSGTGQGGREVTTTLTEPVAIGTAGLNHLRHRQSDVRLRDETRSVRITVRAEGSTRLQVDALTASVR